MRIYGKRQRGAWVLRLVGPLALGNGQNDFRRAVEEVLQRGGLRLILDLSRVAYVDAAGIGELVRAERLVTGAGGELVLADVPRRVDDLLGMYGLRRNLSIVAAVEDAFRYAGAPPATAVSPASTTRSRGPGIMRRTTEGPWRATPIPG